MRDGRDISRVLSSSINPLHTRPQRVEHAKLVSSSSSKLDPVTPVITLTLVAHSPVTVHLCVRAACSVGPLEVPQMEPVVGRKLDASPDRDRLVVCAVVAGEWVVVQHRRPQQRTAQLRRDREVEHLHEATAPLAPLRLAGERRGRRCRKGGLPARLWLREVHKEGVEPRPPRRRRGRVLVVVPPVELARLVPQDLHRLRVRLRHTRQVGDPASDAAQDRVAAAPVVLAPRSRRGADGLHAYREG